MIILQFTGILIASIIIAAVVSVLIVWIVFGILYMLLGDDDEGVETINVIVAITIFSSVFLWTVLKVAEKLMDYFNVSI